MPLSRILILGGGSAGFMAALALKTRLPALDISVIRSPALGIIGVGEGSTVGVTRFFHNTLRVALKPFFDIVQPTWKLGLRFIWGPRPVFFYPFDPGLDRFTSGLPKVNGYYCAADDIDCSTRYAALMAHNRAFERGPDGRAIIHASLAYHFENERLVRFLEMFATSIGIAIHDDTVQAVQQDANGVTGLSLASGRVASADLYVDCSGFVSALLGKALAEPFVSYQSSLFCDRAVVGGWDRGSAAGALTGGGANVTAGLPPVGAPAALEPIQPYTSCATMHSGWCWQIEHEHRINCGYVYSSPFISDTDAESEIRRYRPKVGPTRIVRFVSGRYQRAWVKNVVAIGNACGFVEPLEATALGVIATHSALLADILHDTDRRLRPTQVALYNQYHADSWDGIRDFLAVHYRFNTMLNTPFWENCRRETNLAGAEPVVQFYRENGPSALWGSSLLSPHSQFGMRGYYVMLLGQQVPFDRSHAPSQAELDRWTAARAEHRAAAMNGFTVEEALAGIRSPAWTWASA